MKNPSIYCKGFGDFFNSTILKIMKLTTTLLLFGLLNLSAKTYSQESRLTFTLKDASIQEVLEVLENRTDLKFLYRNETISDQKVTIFAKDATVEEILQKTLANTDVSYKLLSNNLVVITAKELLQQPTVKGTILDAEGQPMPGVNITVEGTTIGVMTDADGKYSIKVTDTNATLVFSFVGFNTEKIAIQGKSVIDLKMVPDVTKLDEIVVVGYGTQKRANVVGAVATVGGDKLQSIPAVNVSNALSGLVAGVSISQQSGEPGQMSPRILIRGRTTLNTDINSRATRRDETAPLVVIDGIPGRSLDEIDPVDIESLSVLKDASAAIYGAQAANGVILIKTKSGKEGKPHLNYQFYQGFMTPTIVPKVTNAAEYATMLSEYQTAQGKARTYSDKDIELFGNGKDPWRHPNTDWYGDLIKKYTSTTRHNISLDGGSKGMTYYVSLGYKSDDAFYKASSTQYKQYNVRTKVELPITNWLKTGVELAGFLNNRVYPFKSADAIVGQSTRLLPTSIDRWPTGEPGPDIEYGDNPIETSTLDAGKSDQKTYRLLSTFNTTITVPFIKGLSFNGSYSFDLTNFYKKEFFQPWMLYSADFNAASVIKNAEGFVTSAPLTGQLKGLSSPENRERYERTINQTNSINANYVKSFGNHNISLMAAFEQYTNDYNYYEGYRKYYISPLITTMDAGNAKDQTLSGSQSIYARKSYIGRATYDYQSKYLAEVTFRADGSLKFPTTKRWGYFPSVLLGWRASEEGFWKNNISVVNYFKLRTSYGEMGMDPTDPFQFMDKYGIGTGMIFGTSGAIQTVVGPPTISNPNITWETQKSYNVGFESKFMNDLFHLNAEFFYNKRENILITRNASVPNFTGLSLPKQNLGVMENHGIEFDAGVHKSLSKDLRIDVTGNFSFNRNKIVYMDEPAQVVAWQTVTGHPYGAWLMYDAIGIFKDQPQVDATTAKLTGTKPGDVIFRDVNGDGKITSDDKILVDRTDAPETFYGANVTVTWKAFTFSAQIQGQGKFLKKSQYDNRRGEAGNYYQWQYDNRWTPTNTNTSIARAYNRDDLYWSPDVNMSTYWLDNTAYCRLKNILINYAIPTRFYSRFGISKASIYFTGNNLALIYSATKKWDPETDNPGVYPTMKTFAFGANISF